MAEDYGGSDVYGHNEDYFNLLVNSGTYLRTTTSKTAPDYGSGYLTA